jgi:segregation and condensation protein B
MSLKAKLEAVIYAAEEPVTLNQLAALFAADALEWKAAQEAAAAEQAAEVAGFSPQSAQPLPLIEQGPPVSISLAEGMPSDASEPPKADTGDVSEPAATTTPDAPQTEAPPTNEVVSISNIEAYPSIMVEGMLKGMVEGETDPLSEEPAPSSPSADPENEPKRLARQKDREVKAVLKQLLDELVAGSEVDGRGIEIREIAGGYRMATKPECHDAVRLFVKSLKPPLKLSLPALETLAVIAYKQPVTAPEVSEIRGVESAGVLGSLLARKLIATAGRKPVIGRPILYKTTREFLLRFGLKDVSELPSMEEFEKMAATELEMEPEVVEADKAAENAEAAATDSAGEDAESVGQSPEGKLESNSPSGEELAGAAETEESETGTSEVAIPEIATPADSETIEPETEPSADTAPVATADREGSSPSQAVPDEPAPTESGTQQEIEATPHAQESKKES